MTIINVGGKMGTRGAFGFYAQGKEKIAYNHYDSYPACLGASVVSFVLETPDEELAAIAERLIPVDERDKPTLEQLVEVDKWLDKSESIGESCTWYVALRRVQGDLDAFKDGLRYILDSWTFLYDSLFCEWAYIINVDVGALEIYKGFNKDRKASGRYANVPYIYQDGADRYAGVELRCAIPFEVIRSIGNAGKITEVLCNITDRDEGTGEETNKTMEQVASELWDLVSVRSEPLRYRIKRFEALALGDKFLSRGRTMVKNSGGGAVDVEGSASPFAPMESVVVKVRD